MGRRRTAGRSVGDSELPSSRTRAGSRTEKTRKRTQKQRARDIKRLLKRENVSATVRQTQERMLTLLEAEMKDDREDQRVKKWTKKYKMVRFFDRRKLVRKMKALNRQIAECEEESERAILSDHLTVLRKEYNYVVHFPANEKYISVHSSSGSSTDSNRRKLEEIQDSIDSLVTSGSLPDASLDVITFRGETVSVGQTEMKQKKQKLRKLSSRVSRNTAQADGEETQKDIYFIDTSQDDFFLQQ